MSFADYQDILTLWTSVLHNLLSECGNVGLFMVGLTRFDCILFILTVFILLFIFTIFQSSFSSSLFSIFSPFSIFRGLIPVVIPNVDAPGILTWHRETHNRPVHPPVQNSVVLAMVFSNFMELSVI